MLKKLIKTILDPAPDPDPHLNLMTSSLSHTIFGVGQGSGFITYMKTFENNVIL